MEKKYKIAVIPTDTQAQSKKEVELQTDKESLSDGDCSKDAPKTLENL